MRVLRSYVFGVVALLSLNFPRNAAAQQFYTVDPRATYLRTFADAPASPTVIFLGAATQPLFLKPSGEYAVAGGGPLQPGHFWAVFSSSNVFLPDNGLLNRVVGAIDVGAPLNQTAVTAPSFYGGQPMDILEDFFIPDGGLTVDVPIGAQYLFVGTPDSYFADNNTPNASQLGLTVVTGTPEPASLALAATGLLGVAGACSRRRSHGALRRPETNVSFFAGDV